MIVNIAGWLMLFIKLLKGIRMITDTQRIDFIENLLKAGDCFELDKNALIDSQPNQEDLPIQLFTVLTQHIRGESVRELIDIAIKKSSNPPEYYDHHLNELY